MKPKHVRAATLVASLLTAGMAAAQVPLGSEFTFQGQLNESGSPVDGLTDFEFTLWNAPHAGSQIGPTVELLGVQVENGLFIVQLDFGAESFDGASRWLQITVTYPSGAGSPVTLYPRQALTAVPYALQTRGLFVNDDLRVGIGSTEPAGSLHVMNDGSVHGIRVESTAIPIHAVRDSASGTWPAVNGECASNADGTSAVRGRLTSETPSATGAGVYGYVASTGANGVGVRGYHSGSGKGVLAEVAHADGYAGYFVGGRNYFEGYVGIGTSGADSHLHVYQPSASTADHTARFVSANTPPFWTGLAIDGAAINSEGFLSASLHLNDTSTGNVSVAAGGGNVGIGTTTPTRKLEVAGDASVQVLFIHGADLAERFPTSEQAEPGTVMAIDPTQPGQLCVARGGYNRNVAGVVSGANGLSAGAVLGNQPGLENAPAIALSGRVWVRCDASTAPIRPGDLLTTSPTAGYAMSIQDEARARGAILGKAMTSLDAGKGLVLVLISLQ